MHPFLQECRIDLVSPAAVAAQTEIVSSILDMAGYDGVIFLAITGDVTATSVLTLTAKGNSEDSTSGAAAISGAATDAFTAGASDADSAVLAVDVVRPADRYVFASLTRTTANAVVNSILAIRYKAHRKPVVNDALLASAMAIVG